MQAILAFPTQMEANSRSWKLGAAFETFVNLDENFCEAIDETECDGVEYEGEKDC
jgi:hypothetical protein